MSQNSHQLLLFFADQTSHETALRALLELRREAPERSAPFQAQLGVELNELWTENWFNQQFSAQPEFLRLDFDTSTSAPLPLQLLGQLFQGALRAAVVEVFYDQVGETQRYHFSAGKLVNRDAFYLAEPEAGRAVDGQLPEPDEGECIEVAKPTSLKQLLAEQKSEAKQRDETVQAFIELAKVSRETGSNPLEVVQVVMVLGGLAKGLLQAFVFTLVTVLLFKGVWLWIGLGLVLAVVLPLYYATQANKPFTADDNDSHDNADSDETPEQEQPAC
ncbi:hypothetical protein ACVW0Y_003706 [Pseudomonas sp. TE3786]